MQVALTTFDTPSELAKLARWHPSAKALLRIRADDPAARCQLGNKYGAEPEDATALLKVSPHATVYTIVLTPLVSSQITEILSSRACSTEGLA